MNTINKENEKNNFIGNMKASFSGRKFRSGAYATIISVIVIVMILVVNLLVSKMEIQFDLSTKNMYTLSGDTKNYLKSIKDDITIYYIIQQGNEAKDFEKIAKQYDKLSSKITLEKKDPILYPKFASQYVTDEVAEGGFIVVNNTNKRAKYISYDDMLVQELDYNTFQNNVTGIDVEGKLTSALLYVTTEDIPVMYVTEGHGEVKTGDIFNSSISKMNLDMQTLNTLTTDSIPEDCDILYINNPAKDLSDAETTMIKDYLAVGGKAIITLDYKTSGLTNLFSILDYYGIKVVNGRVLEGDQNQYLSKYPNYIIPIVENHDITSKIGSGGIPVFMPDSTGLTISDTKRSSLTVEGLLSTSDSAYSKVNISSTTAAKEAGDIPGPFYLGLVATDTYNNITSNVIVFSSGFTFSEDTATYGNAALLTGTVGYLSGEAQTLAIPPKSTAGDFVNPSSLQAFFWGAIAIFVIPIAVFITGSVICFRRRKK